MLAMTILKSWAFLIGTCFTFICLAYGMKYIIEACADWFDSLFKDNE